MFRHKFSQTGIPFLILSFLLIGAIVYLEKDLLSRVNDLPVISISADFDDDFENLSIQKSDITNMSDHVKLLLKKFIKDKKDFATIKNDPSVELLTKLEKKSLYVNLSQSFYETHNFTDVIESLKDIDLKERIQYQVQFIYAFSLSAASKLERAVKEYQLLVDYDPRLQSATLNLAILLKKLNRCDDAIPVFTQSVSISSGRKKAKGLSGLASCHYGLKHYEDAVKYYRKSIEYRPNSAQTWIALAKSLSATNEPYNKVLDAYNKGIALDTQNYKFHLDKAAFQIDHYDYSDAVSTLKKAKSLSNNPKIHEMISWVYIEQNKRANARKHLSYITANSLSKKQKKRAERLRLYVDKHYEKLIVEIKIKKNSSEESLYLKGLAYRKLGRYKKSIIIFNRLSKSKKYGLRTQIQLARIMRGRKQYAEAIKTYEYLLEKNQNAAFLWFESSLVHERLKEGTQGLKKINRAVELSPENHVYKLAQIRQLGLTEQLPLAISTMDELLLKKPNYARALRLKSELLAETKDTDKLIETYNRLLTIDPDDYDASKKLAEAYVSIGENKSAQDLLVNILEKQSDNVDTRYLLAQSYYNSDQYTDSLNELESLLRLEKNYPQAVKLKNSIFSKLNRK